MAKLTTKKRKNLPASKFALPKERKYPLDTRARAINAKGRAVQMKAKGKLSAAKKDTIITKANRVLGKGKKVKRTTGAKK